MQFSTFRLWAGCLLVGLVPGVALAQITLDANDARNAYVIGSSFTNIDIDILPTMLDLGTTSGTAQTWDFSNVFDPSLIEEGDTIVFSTADPAGQPGASFFPDAEVFTSFTIPEADVTFGSYGRIGEDGLYALGTIVKFGPAEGISEFRPHILTYPLPITAGTSVTRKDTTYVIADPIFGETNRQVEEATLTVTGFGTITLPDGRVRQALRIVLEEVDNEVDDDDNVVDTDHTLEVIFLTEDFDELRFDVDLSYTGGTTEVTNIDYLFFGTLDTALETEDTLPDGFALFANYPNPFNPSTRLQFALPEAAYTRLTVYDMLGRAVATLVDQPLAAGKHTYTFEATGLPSGVYLYRLEAGAFQQTRSMLLLK